MKSHNRFPGAPRCLAALLLAALMGAPVRADIQVERGRLAPVKGEPQVAAASFELRNDTGRELELLKVDSPRAATVELRQRSYDAENRPHLWPVARLEIPPGARVRFQPEGRFFRLVGITGALKAGERVPLVLHFEDEKPVTVELLVVAP